MAVILHADMDAFYASVEQRDDARLCGKPVIVGGLGKRGVVCAASYEARPFGVRSAMPMVQARRLCPHAEFLTPRMSHYASIAADVRDVFYRFTPLVEPLSLDEAYLDVTGSLRLFGGVHAIVDRLRAEMRNELGLAVSVGGGPGKLVAKIASARAKPDGALIVESAAANDFLRPLGIGEIWGVGPATERRLHSLGIATIGQLADYDSARIERELGSWGPTLQALARGDDLRTVEADRSRVSCGEENTFPEDVSDEELIEAVLLSHSESVARHLRREGRAGRTISVKWRCSGPGVDWKLFTRSKTLDAATDDGPTITAAAIGLWRAAAVRQPIRLIGVQLSNLDGARPAQLGLFRSDDEERRDRLNEAMDDLIARFGPGSVRRGGARDD
ncbi:MAG TPA: DNA polymerase IV [Candidatus Limnocylindrales bacterium]|nr:DNA polymerase IV [Candidatus Limnocylindrales bacterium]